MVEIRYTGDALWDIIERAVQKVKDRLRRVVDALEGANIPYAVIGGNAVQLWVAQVDESAVRNTRDVDIVLNRSDLPRAITALEPFGFIYRHAASVDMFLDGPEAKARDAVHVLFTGEKVRAEYVEDVPSIDETTIIDNVRTFTLEALVRMKLTSLRHKDKTHLIDMIALRLIDETWPSRFKEPLSTHLLELIQDQKNESFFEE